MNDLLSNLVARWLAHPTGILQALVTTSVWMATPFLLGWSFSSALFWYLGYCTFVSFATQFTLAYQNQKAAIKLDEAIGTLLQLARNDEADGDALIEQGEAIHAALLELQRLTTDSASVTR